MWVGPQSQHKCPQKREAEREVGHRREGSVTPEAEPGVVWPQAKECRQPSEIGWTFPQELLERVGLC